MLSNGKFREKIMSVALYLPMPHSLYSIVMISHAYIPFVSKNTLGLFVLATA